MAGVGYLPYASHDVYAQLPPNSQFDYEFPALGHEQIGDYHHSAGAPIESTPAEIDSVRGPPLGCLFIASLSTETSETTLKNYFASFGEILKFKVVKDRTTRPYAFVQFKTVEAADEALVGSANAIIDGRRLRVERARVNRTLFIAKIDRSVTSLQLREIMQQYGEVEAVTIIKNHETNKSKGCGFVKYIYREDATTAFNALKNNPRKWVVEWAQSNNDPDNLGIDRCNIFVGGLNPSLVSKELLKERFSPYGKVESVSLVNRDPEDDHKDSYAKSAFAFIRYTDPGASSAAIDRENGADWLDRKIRVQYCESLEMKNKRRAKFVQNQFGQYYGTYLYPMPTFGAYDARFIQERPEAIDYTQYVGFPMMAPAMPLVYANQPWLFTQIQPLALSTLVDETQMQIHHHELPVHEHHDADDYNLNQKLSNMHLITQHPQSTTSS
eukprot:TRINITY_DN370_c0_g1_i2.p1 TRINITY_DN370_c0_g1~~TRINITY_DN370_c0_g1_i2.p1  ORF type:complete len:441 (-),score=76.99 TRINITY_DN370_c0_g1_i2:111-1433(-)